MNFFWTLVYTVYIVKHPIITVSAYSKWKLLHNLKKKEWRKNDARFESKLSDISTSITSHMKVSL